MAYYQVPADVIEDVGVTSRLGAQVRGGGLTSHAAKVRPEG